MALALLWLLPRSIDGTAAGVGSRLPGQDLREELGLTEGGAVWRRQAATLIHAFTSGMMGVIVTLLHLRSLQHERRTVS